MLHYELLIQKQLLKNLLPQHYSLLYYYLHQIAMQYEHFTQVYKFRCYWKIIINNQKIFWLNSKE